MPGNRKRRRASVHTGATPGLGADPQDDRRPVQAKGNLGEIRLLAAEAYHQVLGEEHVATIAIGDRLPAVRQQPPGVERLPRVDRTLP